MVITHLASLVHDKEPVRSNQFLYKAILINTIILMQMPEVNAQMRVRAQLEQTLTKSIEYCENDKNNPLLEEVVQLYSTYLEASGNYPATHAMWFKFLKIQQELLGHDREQMIPTYKKLASLAVATGQPQVS
jgi:hypothetical protein